MKSFRFRIGTANYGTINDLVRLTAFMREKAANYPDLNITTNQLHRHFADINKAVLSNTIQNCVIELLCIGLISYIFIPKLICTVWIILAVISIDIGELHSDLNLKFV